MAVLFFLASPCGCVLSAPFSTSHCWFPLAARSGLAVSFIMLWMTIPSGEPSSVVLFWAFRLVIHLLGARNLFDSRPTRSFQPVFFSRLSFSFFCLQRSNVVFRFVLHYTRRHPHLSQFSGSLLSRSFSDSFYLVFVDFIMGHLHFCDAFQPCCLTAHCLSFCSAIVRCIQLFSCPPLFRLLLHFFPCCVPLPPFTLLEICVVPPHHLVRSFVAQVHVPLLLSIVVFPFLALHLLRSARAWFQRFRSHLPLSVFHPCPSRI